MRGLASDLRHAIRLHSATPLASALAVGALAVALAFVTVFASMWNDLTLKPHPGFSDSDRIVSLLLDAGEGGGYISANMAAELHEEAVTLEGVAGVRTTSRSVEFSSYAETVNIEFVTRAYFPLLKPRMHLGRPLDETDHTGNAEPVAVLSFEFWQRHFGGRRDVLGETFQMRDASYFVADPGGSHDAASEKNHDLRIVGVMAPAMNGTFGGRRTDIWAASEPVSADMNVGGRHFNLLDTIAVARLSSGRSHHAATDELNTRFSEMTTRHPRPGTSPRWVAHPRITTDMNADRQTLRQVHLFLAASILVAVVAAVNLGLFMLARAPGRRREVNIRFALGASRRRIVRQLITEAGLLVVTAALIGLVASLWLAASLQNLAFLHGASWRDVNPMDWRVLVLLCSGAAALTIVAALAPAAGLRRAGIAQAMRQVTARAGRAQRASGIAQIALAGLLGGAALGFGWHLIHMSRASFGFDPSGIVAVTTSMTPERITGGSWERTLTQRANLREVISGLPGVEAVAFGAPVPAVPGFSMSASARHPGDPDHSVPYDLVSIDPEYPRLLGMRLLAGSLPREDDPLGMLVNESLAREMWGHLDVIGNRVPQVGPAPTDSEGEPRIAGVLADAGFEHPHEPVKPMLFNTAAFFAGMDVILLRTQRSPSDIRAAVQTLIDDGTIEFEIDKVIRLQDAWHELLAADRTRARLSIAAAVVAVILAAFGFYGTQRYLVTAGRREYAIQAALGAGPKALRRMVLKRGLALGLPGMALGTLLAFIATGWLQDGFIDQTVRPWAVSLLVATATAGLILAASLGPARQARRMVPAAVLREE